MIMGGISVLKDVVSNVRVILREKVVPAIIKNAFTSFLWPSWVKYFLTTLLVGLGSLLFVLIKQNVGKWSVYPCEPAISVLRIPFWMSVNLQNIWSIRVALECFTLVGLVMIGSKEWEIMMSR